VVEGDDCAHMICLTEKFGGGRVLQRGDDGRNEVREGGERDGMILVQRSELRRMPLKPLNVNNRVSDLREEEFCNSKSIYFLGAQMPLPDPFVYTFSQ
jgi:hypothetical protein